MNRFTKLIPALLAVSFASTLFAQAPSEERWQAFSKDAIAGHIMPNYNNLAKQSTLLSQRIEQFCTEQSTANLTRAQQAFKEGMQAWQKIQHIQFGPVTLLMRNFSLQYWPDKKNLGGRQLNAILQKALEDEGKLKYDQAFFVHASVAVKGYPAMERLLFDNKLLPQLQSNPSYCPLLHAISTHVSQNTQAVATEWAAELANFEHYSEDAVYISAQEAATEILKALVEPIEAISDGKIAAPLGKRLTKMRWRKSESWRSEQSIANIYSNLSALAQLYSGLPGASLKSLLIDAGEQALADKINAQFINVIAALGKVSEPTNMQYTQEQFDQLQAIQYQLKRLSDSLLESMKPLQISLGFNRRDGD